MGKFKTTEVEMIHSNTIFRLDEMNKGFEQKVAIEDLAIQNQCRSNCPNESQN